MKPSLLKLLGRPIKLAKSEYLRVEVMPTILMLVRDFPLNAKTDLPLDQSVKISTLSI